jgi:hypothetical protein
LVRLAKQVSHLFCEPVVVLNLVVVPGHISSKTPV